MLFSHYSIGNKIFKNRLIMLPTVTNYANPDGSITQKNLDYYSLRKNLSAIIVEAAYTHTLGKSFTHQIGIDSNDKIEGLTQLSYVIHNNNTYAGVQLAMNIKSKTINNLTQTEIEYIKNSFIEAAVRAKEANFDIIEVHCAHGWLLGQFLSSYFNYRSDLFGGHLQNRMRLPLEIIKTIRDILKDQILSVRINAVDFIENGTEMDESIVFSNRLKEIGVDLINVSAGIGAKTFIHVSPGSYPNGFLLDYAHKIKISTNLPTVAANRLNDFDLASAAIEQSKADFIGLARALIADPNIITKWQNTQFEAVVPCISCNQACIANIQAQKQMSCLMNPKPYETNTFERPFMYRRKIMIIGAGPAGLALAVFARQKGLDCVIFEKQAKIGGQINLAIKPPHKQEFKKMLNYFEYKIKNLKIPLFTNVEVNIDLIKSEKPDVVAFALGSNPYIPDFALGNEFVTTADEALEFGLPFDARSVCVLGGGLSGLETANFLAHKGLSVSVFELEDSLLKNTMDVVKIPIIESMYSNIKFFLSHKLINIKNNTAYFQTNNGPSEHSFDYIVLSLGRKPNRELINQINFCIDTIDIGDCKNPQDAQAAISDAYNAAQIL
ncbi:2,4-dienoyl-CoA reductase [NADPH] [Desulfurella amilsii]|uniref:2,4-dienoyl-CoA reductase [NADPH] n=1 Tax=Desulfurella amilsii TaxID=1562698 RepID=A0A1X4XY22_9BACT|nr:2,4-dienoyl-CoA reductase [NADPH] [Desulfurella amilsii]